MQPKTPLSSRIATWIKNHKVWTFVILIVLSLATYQIVKTSTSTGSQTSYVIGTADTGTVVSTVTGTGQVSSINEITVPAKTGGEVTSVRVTAGQKVTEGEVIASVDDTSAGISLQQAQDTLAKAKQQLVNDTETQQLATQNQQVSLNSSLVSIADKYNNDSVNPTLSGTYNSTEKGEYDLRTYSCAAGVCIEYSGIESGDVPVTPNVPMVLGTRGLYLNFSTKPNIPDSWTVQVPSPLATGYLSQTQNIATSQENDQITLANDQAAINDAQVSLESAQLSYDNTFVTAPVSGTVGQVSIVKGQNLSSGATVVTLVGSQQYADIPFNEVDVAKIAIGDHATATFDAVSGLTITGKVTSIDQVGTVTSGVVNYNVRISFDIQDPRIKSGMSTSVVVATDVATDAVIVPSNAIKTSGGSSYVLTVPSDTPVSTGSAGIVLATPPVETSVTTGISDDENTQIVSGLSAGDKIVTKTTTAAAVTTTATKTPSATSILGGGTRIPGGGR